MRGVERVVASRRRERADCLSVTTDDAGVDAGHGMAGRASGGVPRLAIYEKASPKKSAWVAARRRRECLAHVVALGGTIDSSRDVFCDRLVSAHNFRPVREALMEQVRGSAYDGVMVWQLSDIASNRWELSRLIELMRMSSCDLHVPSLPSLTLFSPASILLDAFMDVATVESLQRRGL